MFSKSALKRSWLGGRLFWSLPTTSPRVAITFDDGPHPEYTAVVLDRLAEAGAKATFFCVGKAARQYPALVKRIVAEGHTLACHTDTHADLAKIGSKRSWEECRRSRETLEEIGCAPVRYLRPPWGHMGLTTLPIALANRMRVALWSFDSCDYKELTSEQLIMRVRTAAPGPGSIALFHDDECHTVQALPAILAHFKEREMECVTLDSLAQSAKCKVQSAKCKVNGHRACADGRGNGSEGRKTSGEDV